MSEQQSQDELAELISYPADLSIKAMGLNTADFEAWVVGLIEPILAPQKANKVDTRESSGGKYLSVTLYFTAANKAHYQLVYSTLRDDTRVLFTL